MAIRITTKHTEENLVGKTHWWGFPDMPVDKEWPCGEDGELLTFICQIRLEDIAPYDLERQLPHTGMLWFFAELDYFLGDMEAPCGGIGEWEKERYKVIYSSESTELRTHEYYWEDGSPAVLDAEKMEFGFAEDSEYGLKLLGQPSMTEGYENENEGLVSLLQLDEEERWNLRFFDCGMINFMIPVDSLAALDFEAVSLKLQSL